MSQPLQVVVVGAPDDTHNLGVSALHHSVLAGILERRPDTSITVFDHGFGRRQRQVLVAGQVQTYSAVGLRNSRRIHRRASLANVRFSSRFGGLGNPAARAMLDADAILDISGGDSFSDIYGQKRFEAIAQPKELSLARRRRLVLLPQTYGPFREADNERRAREIVRHATLAVARDDRSYEALRLLTATTEDDPRYQRGVDVAFRLERTPPSEADATRWLELLGSDRALIGLNVSGLVYNDEDGSTRFGLSSSYRQTVHLLVRRLLDETDATIVFVPHVLGTRDDDESDPRAAEAVRREFPDRQDRLVTGPLLDDPSTAKWLIDQLSWFCGTRMHATIAALSSGVPAAALAYSGKTVGVFESCDQSTGVADLRILASAAAVDRVMQAWRDRQIAADRLAVRLPEVLRRASDQMDLIVETCEAAPTPRRRSPRAGGPTDGAHR